MNNTKCTNPDCYKEDKGGRCGGYHNESPQDPMNKIETVMKQGLEELNSKLIDVSLADGIEELARTTLKYREALEAHQKDLLEAVVAEVKGEGKEFVPADQIQIGGIASYEWKLVPKEDGMYCLNCGRFTVEEGCLCGMRSLQDIETLINKAIDTCGTQQKE